MRYAGLIAAVILGIVVAAFPLYAGVFTPYIWSYKPAGAHGGEEAGGRTVSGVIDGVDAASLTIVVRGMPISVRGTWLDASSREELSAEALVTRLKPGYHVIVSFEERGRWGAMADRITVEELGKTFVRV